MAGPKRDDDGVTRRQFLVGAAVGAAAAGAAGLPLPAASAEEGKPKNPGGVRSLGPDAVLVDFTVNGRSARVLVEPRVTLLDALRNHLDLTGAKRVCDRGACGACTVLVDGRPLNSCMTLAVDAAGRKVETVEGFAPDGALSDLMENFVRCDALQCGFCTPGMVVACESLLRRTKSPTPAEVNEAISGNLCRCGTYPRIVKAVVETGKAR